MNDAGNYEVVMFGKVRTTVQERQIQKILGSDMGLQELLIAFWQWIHEGHEDDELEQATRMKVFVDMYDLTKNLHQQSEEFYQAILPLINE